MEAISLANSVGLCPEVAESHDVTTKPTGAGWTFLVKVNNTENSRKCHYDIEGGIYISYRLFAVKMFSETWVHRHDP